jgi:hypothetical protein
MEVTSGSRAGWLICVMSPSNDSCEPGAVWRCELSVVCQCGAREHGVHVNAVLYAWRARTWCAVSKLCAVCSGHCMQCVG